MPSQNKNQFLIGLPSLPPLKAPITHNNTPTIRQPIIAPFSEVEAFLTTLE